jgi:hypothetical protein
MRLLVCNACARDRLQPNAENKQEYFFVTALELWFFSQSKATFHNDQLQGVPQLSTRQKNPKNLGKLRLF